MSTTQTQTPEAPSQPLPAAVDVERSVLGAAMIDDVACSQAVQMLKPKLFYDQRHRQIFASIKAQFTGGEDVDLVTVTEDLKDEVPPAYLADLVGTVASASNQERHCRIVQEKWMLRHMHTLGQRLAMKARDEAEDPIDLLEKGQRALTDMIVFQSGETHIRAAVDEAIEQVKDWHEGRQSDRAPSGFYSLDRMTGGLPVGEATWINGHTGSGKTSFLVQIAAANARRQIESDEPKGIAVFSIEMSRKQLTLRMAQNVHRLSTAKLRNQQADDEEYVAFQKTLHNFREQPVHILDQPAPTLEQMKAQLVQIQARDGLGLVLVDYDEKVRAPGDYDEARVANIARGLKDLAKRFEVPVVTAGQYNRKYADGGYKYGVPSNDWMRASGKKQQEAYMILHWHWPGYWVENGDADPGMVDDYDHRDPNKGYLVVSKNRDGQMGKVPLRFHPEHTFFEDINQPNY